MRLNRANNLRSLSAGALALLAACASVKKGPSLSAPSLTSDRGDPPILLLTGFEPFGKWNVNLSFEVAEAIRRHPEKIASSIEIRTCLLPVEYDKAAQTAISCLENLPRRPRMIVSLGEGDCSIRLETGVTNLDHTPGFADNAGVIRTDAAIIPLASRRQGLSLPVRQMYCAVSEPDRTRLRVSVSAGNYVCNNTAFRMANVLTHLAPTIRYGFIHVPHSGCKDSEKNVEENARIVGQALHAAWTLPSSPDAGKILPASLEEVRVHQQTLQGPAPCEQHYWNSLLQGYEKAPKIF